MNVLLHKHIYSKPPPSRPVDRGPRTERHERWLRSAASSMDAFPFKLVFDQLPFPADAAAGSPLPAPQTSAGGRRRQRKRGSGVKLSTDPQSVAARERRHRISHRFKILQSLVPGGSKMDTVSMLEEAIHYVKFLQTQISLHNSVMAAAASSEEYPTAAPFFAAATVAAPALPASNSLQAHSCYETHAASAIGNSSGSSALLPQPAFGYPTAPPFPQLIQGQAAAYPCDVEEEDDDQLFSGLWVPGNC